MVKKAAILARVSRDRQETESQIKDLQFDAELEGYVVPEEYIFSEKITGMDSYDKEERESLQNLKSVIETKQDIEVVFMWELTRLSRNPYFLIEQLRWFNYRKIPIYFHDLEKWTINRETLVEDFETTNRIFGAATYGQQEWEKIKKRTKRGRDAKARKGLFVGHIADGYKVTLVGLEKHIVLDEERVPLIKDIFNMYTEQQMSTDRIARELNERGILTFNALEAKRNEGNDRFSQVYKKKNTNIELLKSEIKWTASSIGQLLKNRWYIGERQYNKVTYGVPSIISEEQFEKAQHQLIYNKKVITKRRESVYPLKGLLVCGKCGQLMYGHKVRINSSYYCSSLETGKKCGAEGICKQNIDGIIWDYIQYIQFYMLRHYGMAKLSTIFGLENIDKELLQESIDKKKLKIKQKKQRIEDLSIGLAELIIQKSSSVNATIINVFSKKQIQIEKDIDSIENEIKELEVQIAEDERIIDRNASIDETISDKIGEVERSHDMKRVYDIIHQLILRVTLYNLEDYYKLIEIEVSSHRKFYAIYNSRKLKGRYIQVPFTNDDFSYNKETNRFQHRYKFIGMLNTMEIEKEGKMLTREMISKHSEGDIDKLIEVSRERSLPYLLCDFSTTELIGFLGNWHYIRNIRRIELEPSDEEFQKWKEDYKKWDKVRNMRKKEKRKLLKSEVKE
ncbi:recombinase family protein [Bacteroides thetaiotaomicron]|uniref:recombinase family protein n=1 Tax=Bacteroides thetaiotaomicron TaxID=818 RepID=UPI001925FB25|nr:recombinase family protein [Bacteroides thetaiotaomicron]MBL3917639.1 recombinase family protein [Bacteroides thetaiotaomicron]MBL3941846.1 recombinase family protein [Bacteroides thetaiotaomicron]MBL3946635.1 recombinase family protein [Bacteroides thetaiotaomicron]MBL3956903.1 recombinase family protein [Bacteroides thetaiotaomicron]